MIETLFHTTEYNNFYIYDDHSRLSMLTHPEFIKAYENASNVNPYYLKKYGYLREHGFFEKCKISNFIPMNDSMIKESIIQTPHIVLK